MTGQAFDYSYRALACAALLLVGLGIFARIMYVRTRLMLAGRPETRWDLVKDRALRLLQIGLGQRKMFKEPYAGALHAFTFWGFLVVQIRALQLFGMAFVPDFEPLFALQPLYDIGKDFTELIVIVTVSLFFYRRLVTQPARIHYSGEALFILGCIGWLMVSDLLFDVCHFGGRAALVEGAEREALLNLHAPIGAALARMFASSGIDGGTLQAAGELFYWGHLAAILTMLNLLPISKHFHVITALPNVFLSNLEPTGALEAVDDIEEKIERGERLGIGQIEDLSWKQMLDLYTCTECGRCTVNCPAWNTDKPLSPAFIIKDLQTHLYDQKDRLLAPTATSGTVEELPEGALPPLVAALNPDAIWSCTTCRSCSEQCPVMIEHVDKIVGVRRHLVMNHNSFPEELVTTLTNLENKSNPWGIAASKRDAWAKQRGDIPTLEDNPNPEYLYFVGCAGALDDRAQKVTDAVVSILKAAGVDFAIMGRKEKCSGDPARRMGHEYLFQESARENIETMQQFDVRKVIATCPHCFNTIKNEYPQLGGKFEVIHHTQLIRKLLDGGKLTLKEAARLRITYHDSCYMGRYNDVYDEPRQILANVPGVELVEMERSKQLGMCCGAGGARMFMEEKIGSRVNHLRIEQAMETQPQVVAVNCPWCMTMVKDGLREKAIDTVEARDIAEIVLDALELPDYARGKCEPVSKAKTDAPAPPDDALPAAPTADGGASGAQDPGDPQPDAAAADAAGAAAAPAAPARKKASKKKKKKASAAAEAQPEGAESSPPPAAVESALPPAAVESAPPPAPASAPADDGDASKVVTAAPTRKKASKKKKKVAAPAKPPTDAPSEPPETAPAAAQAAPPTTPAPPPAPSAAPPTASAASSFAKAPTRKKTSKKKKKSPADAE